MDTLENIDMYLLRARFLSLYHSTATLHLRPWHPLSIPILDWFLFCLVASHQQLSPSAASSGDLSIPRVPIVLQKLPLLIPQTSP